MSTAPLHTAPVHPAPVQTVWWQLHPLTFLGAEPRALPADAPCAHRLGRLEPWLDYLVELGCDGLALGPVFASSTHGYDTVDHFRVDPRLGTDEDFDRLVAACRQRGVKLLLDGVFNHVSRDFGPFRDVRAHGAASAYASWFRIDWSVDGPDGFGYADFEGHRHLVALDHAEPAVQDHVRRVMDHWLRRGAHGWRLDAAYAVPSSFWRDVIGPVRADHPDAWFLGEVIHGDYTAAVSDGGLDSVTQYELWKALWSSLNDHNFFELAWTLDRHNGLAALFQPLTFVGNHDVTRMASRLDDPRHLAHALAVLFTVAGTPSVYAGDEQAFRGVKYEREDGDAEIRPAFPDSPSGLAPHGRPVYRLHQNLIGLRRRHPWLVRARTEVLHLDNQAFAYRAVDPESGARLAVLLNISDSPVDFPSVDASAERLLAGAPYDDAADAGPTHRVAPHAWAVLELPSSGDLRAH
ncbi:alpha-amylase family glycosyl hydrolase [Streptomyces sp. NBC_00457]|uniref:alpha-amylase family glycosyl hydrolase n=1 Tax=Streptomyces sp. NBC_00457 TaxID=2975748 RepID=UPI002E228937